MFGVQTEARGTTLPSRGASTMRGNRPLFGIQAERALDLLVAVTALAGFSAMAGMLAAGGYGSNLSLLILVALAIFTEVAGVKLYFDGRLSLSFMAVIVAALAFGPAATAIIATTNAITASIVNKGNIRKFLFNLGLGNAAGFCALGAASLPLIQDHINDAAVALPAGAGIAIPLFAVPSLAVSAAIALSKREPVLKVHAETFRWMLPHYLGLGAVAGGLALAYDGLGAVSLLLLAAPLALARHSVSQVIDKTRDTMSQLETSNSQLRRANAANSAILEAIPDVMYHLNAAGHVLEMNAPGSPREDGTLKRGMHFADGFEPRVARKLRGEIAIAQRTRSVRMVEYSAAKDDGSIGDYEARVVPVKGGEALLMVRDISDRRRAQQAQALAEELRRSATANAPVILFAADATGRIGLIEGQGLERLPNGGAGAVGRLAWDLFDDPEAMREAFETVWQSGAPCVVTAETGDRALEIHLSRTAGDRERQGVIGVALDITERRRVQEAVVETQKLESLGVLAGGIAHDFNNLLVGILGNADMALVEVGEHSPARATIQEIRLAGRRAADLARQMLAYAGKGRLEMQRIDFGRLVLETTQLLRSTVNRGVSFELDVARGTSFVEVDGTQLRQVVMNLVVNASDAIGDGEGRITVSVHEESPEQEMLASAYGAPELEQGRYVCLRVSDTGCGMDAETMSRIFDPFFTTKVKGHGLGLAAVVGIIRSHRGAIRVESEPGKGTTFTVLLPAVEAGEMPGEDIALAARRLAGSGTILVVDDDDTVRHLTRKALTLYGFNVLEADDGEAGVERFLEHAGNISAVILDMTMPRLSGDEALARIRELAPEAKVIMMSGYASEDGRMALDGRGADAFIQKPFTLDTLHNTLRDVLGPRAA